MTSLSLSVTDLLKFSISPGFTFVRSYAFESFSFLLGFQLFGRYIFKAFPNDLLDSGRALQNTDSLLLFLKVSLFLYVMCVFRLDVYVCTMVDHDRHSRSCPATPTDGHQGGMNTCRLSGPFLYLSCPGFQPGSGVAHGLPTSVNTTRMYSERHAQRPIPQVTLESAQLTMTLSQR